MEQSVGDVTVPPADSPVPQKRRSITRARPGRIT